jgi:hypothetical protein
MCHTHDIGTKEAMGFITKQVWADYVEYVKQ